MLSCVYLNINFIYMCVKGLDLSDICIYILLNYLHDELCL